MRGDPSVRDTDDKTRRLGSNGVLTRQDPHTGLMVVVGEYHPVRRHVYNPCLLRDGSYVGSVCVGEQPAAAAAAAAAEAPLEDDPGLCTHGPVSFGVNDLQIRHPLKKKYLLLKQM